MGLRVINNAFGDLSEQVFRTGAWDAAGGLLFPRGENGFPCLIDINHDERPSRAFRLRPVTDLPPSLQDLLRSSDHQIGWPWVVERQRASGVWSLCRQIELVADIGGLLPTDAVVIMAHFPEARGHEIVVPYIQLNGAKVKEEGLRFFESIDLDGIVRGIRAGGGRNNYTMHVDPAGGVDRNGDRPLGLSPHQMEQMNQAFRNSLLGQFSPDRLANSPVQRVRPLARPQRDTTRGEPIRLTPDQVDRMMGFANAPVSSVERISSFAEEFETGVLARPVITMPPRPRMGRGMAIAMAQRTMENGGNVTYMNTEMSNGDAQAYVREMLAARLWVQQTGQPVSVQLPDQELAVPDEKSEPKPTELEW